MNNIKMDKRKAKISKIKVWYRFGPGVNIWFSKMGGESELRKLIKYLIVKNDEKRRNNKCPI